MYEDGNWILWAKRVCSNIQLADKMHLFLALQVLFAGAQVCCGFIAYSKASSTIIVHTWSPNVKIQEHLAGPGIYRLFTWTLWASFVGWFSDRLPLLRLHISPFIASAQRRQNLPWGSKIHAFSVPMVSLHLSNSCEATIEARETFEKLKGSLKGFLLVLIPKNGCLEAIHNSLMTTGE